ncbi:unnamed protein product [Tetraodon nigroviridis]|uniref:(spotted green pufferfish) hypothetical protein n=1 Tax=Tetraodon nigroviridis TaxID=99883 RepID=Q4S637_TETNG|nr:unnamed protein product [Tetraodon nigroviridis]
MEVAGFYDEGSFAIHARDSIISPVSSHRRLGDSMSELGLEERERAIDFSFYLDSGLYYPQQQQQQHQQGDVFPHLVAETKIKKVAALQNYKNYSLLNELETSHCDSLRGPREPYALAYNELQETRVDSVLSPELAGSRYGAPGAGVTPPRRRTTAGRTSRWRTAPRAST